MVSVKQLAQRSSGLLATSIQSWLWGQVWPGSTDSAGITSAVSHFHPVLVVEAGVGAGWGWVGKRGWWGQVWPGPADSAKIT